MSYFKRIFIKNEASDVINPATEEKQDSIINELQGINYITANYYLYETVATPVLTSSTAIGDKVININSNANVNNGDAITFYQDANMYQSIIIANTSTTITLGSEIDNIFTSDAVIETGNWNMAVDGSSVTRIFSIKAPPSADINIFTINCSLLDTTDMDDGKFGGLPQLSKGVVFYLKNGFIKNMALIVNNLGFWEIGFTTSYDDKAPAGHYGFKARRNIKEINGTTVSLTKGMASEFQIHIQDDLTDLTLFAATINGHLK